MKKTLFLAALMALLFCSCKQTYLRLGDNQELCTVQSVVQTPDGFFVCLEKDTIFCEEDPQIEQNSIVIFDHDSMCLLKLYYSYATDCHLAESGW